MSSVQENLEADYDENRFQGPVRRDLICSICHEVLNDPRICQNKEHPFCLACILRHLQDSPTCPVCREHLTPETLKRPARFFMNCLLELNINCDYNDRGCPEYVQLENLQSHVDQCGFAPATCGNEGCGMEINRRDKVNHEKNFCHVGISKCYDCRDVRPSQVEMKASEDEGKARNDETEAQQDETKAALEGIRASQRQMKASQNEIKFHLEEVKHQLNEVKREQEKICARIRQIDAGERQLQVRATYVKSIHYTILPSILTSLNISFFQQIISVTSSK